MAPPSSGKLVSFGDVALRGRAGIILLILIVLTVVAFSACAAISSTGIPSISGEAQNEEISFEVPSHSEQPVRIRIAHEYELRRIWGTSLYTVEGDDLITYNLTVSNDVGERVAREDSQMTAPETHEFSSGETHHTVTVENVHGFTLVPGRYTVTVVSSHPVGYIIMQKSVYEGSAAMLGGVGLLLTFLLGVFVWRAMKKRDAMQLSQIMAAMGPPPHVPSYVPAYLPPAQSPWQPVPQYGTPAAQYPAYGAGAAIYQGGYPGAPSYPPPLPVQDPATVSNLQPAPGSYYAEVVCTACGWTVRNPPINGVVTCQHCGEQGRLF